MKKLISILLTLALIVAFAGCGGSNTNSDTQGNTPDLKNVECNIYGIAGPTGIGLANLMAKAEKGEGSLKYNIALAGSNDEIIAKIVNKEADIAAVATNLASVLYNNPKVDVQVLAVNTLGVLSVITKGYEINSISDLKGKTICTTGQGANPEYIINDILKNNGLTVGKDVTVNFVAAPTDLAPLVKQNKKIVVIAPQPVATAIVINNPESKFVLNINDEWDKFHDQQLTMGCIVVRKDYAEQNPEAVAAFLDEYKASIEGINNDIEGTAELCEKYKIIASAAMFKKAIPQCNVVYQDGKTMKTNLSAYLKFLYDLNPKSIGGNLPSNDFYYGVK